MWGNDWIFGDRTDAGRELARRLASYKSQNPIVLGIPRGGVQVAAEIAAALDAPLDVAVARKLGAPFQPELGIGAIAPGNVRLLDETVVEALNISTDELDRITLREETEMDRRLELFRRGRPPLQLEGRVVIVVDDGIATGVTTRAAVRSVRLQSPSRLVLAAPVCPLETARLLQEEVDELVCIATPMDFRAVGIWYRDFTQLTDDDVAAILRSANTLYETAHAGSSA